MDDKTDSSALTKEHLIKRLNQFQEMFKKAQSYTDDLIEENKRLKRRLSSLLAGKDVIAEDLPLEGEEDGRRSKELERQNRRLEKRILELEEENKDFAEKYMEIEEQNNNLANLYVASYQLHSTLNFKEVISNVVEIIINLVGAEIFSIMLLDEKTKELVVVASEGVDTEEQKRVALGKGSIGEVATTGEPFFEDLSAPGEREAEFEKPIACVPLKFREEVIGVISINKLFVQKENFTSVDYDLFSLLAQHASTAIFSSKLYSQSERKLSTIQGFLDLMTSE
jgi:transcriptional regulator with GAF, ATPase, and Fis domain